MNAVRGISIVVALLLFASLPARAQDPHHPGPSATTVSQVPVGQPPMTGGMSQGAGLGCAMPMMGARGMMGQDGMMDPDGMMGRMKPMMGMEGHIDGWLAFLRTELRITDTQAAAWNDFADAMRANAVKMNENHASMMPQDAASSGLPARFATQEKMVAGRLDTLRRISQAVDPFYAALNDEQKRLADELLGPHGMM